MKSLIILKPDALKRGLAGKILTRFEDRGFTISRMMLLKPSVEKVREHYAHLKDRPEIFNDTVNYMTSGKVLVVDLSLEDNEDTIELVRQMVGETSPLKAEMGTIRADFSNKISRNIIHASDSQKSYEKESWLWFT